MRMLSWRLLSWRPLSWRLWSCALVIALPATAAVAQPYVGRCPVFPTDNIWNAPVDALPVDPQSDAYIATIGPDISIHPDFGAGLYEGDPMGIPYVVVPFDQPDVPIIFAPHSDEPEAMPDESDAGPYPIPPDAPIEGGDHSIRDRHVVVIKQGSCTLYELYKAARNADGSWNAVSAAKFDLEGNELRIDTWTSADAAGLPIFPGLVRFDETVSGKIEHALRFTVPKTRNAYVWPARHEAADSDDPALPPMGQRFRLKAGVDISGFSPTNQIILQALKTYGMILADNGSAMFVQGEPHDFWDNDDLSELGRITAADFEAVDSSGLMVNPDSAQTAR